MKFWICDEIQPLAGRENFIDSSYQAEELLRKNETWGFVVGVNKRKTVEGGRRKEKERENVNLKDDKYKRHERRMTKLETSRSSKSPSTSQWNRAGRTKKITYHAYYKTRRLYRKGGVHRKFLCSQKLLAKGLENQRGQLKAENYTVQEKAATKS